MHNKIFSDWFHKRVLNDLNETLVEKLEVIMGRTGPRPKKFAHWSGRAGPKLRAEFLCPKPAISGLN